jgi:hypothetical protein
MIPPPDLGCLDSAAKDALILALIERLNDLTARVSASSYFAPSATAV